MTNAASIPKVSSEALASFRNHSHEIIRETVARSLERKEEVRQHGDRAEDLLTTGLEFTTQMLDTAMEYGSLAILEDQLTWAMERLPHDGVAPTHILARLQIYSDVVDSRLPAEHAAEVNRYVQWMVDRQGQMMDNTAE